MSAHTDVTKSHSPATGNTQVDAAHSGNHIVPIPIYLMIFGALMVGTAATVGAAYIDLGRWNIVVALLIACIKASLVILFFMHIAYSTKLTKTIVLVGIATLLIMFFFTSTDLIARGWFTGSTPWMGVPGR